MESASVLMHRLFFLYVFSKPASYSRLQRPGVYCHIYSVYTVYICIYIAEIAWVTSTFLSTHLRNDGFWSPSISPHSNKLLQRKSFFFFIETLIDQITCILHGLSYSKCDIKYPSCWGVMLGKGGKTYHFQINEINLPSYKVKK